MFFWDKPRPQKRFEIRECGKESWEVLRKYHYLNTDLSATARCYGLYDKDMIIGFCAVIHFPHPNNPRIKHIHRLVIHPDYQDIGIGSAAAAAVTGHKFMHPVHGLHVHRLPDGATLGVALS